MERRIFHSARKDETILHCRVCYDVLGVIRKGRFNLYDVSWPCGNCGELNKSFDYGQEEVRDDRGARHVIFTLTDEDVARIHQYAPNRFHFQRAITNRDLVRGESSFGQFNRAIRTGPKAGPDKLKTT